MIRMYLKGELGVVDEEDLSNEYIEQLQEANFCLSKSRFFNLIDRHWISFLAVCVVAPFLLTILCKAIYLIISPLPCIQILLEGFSTDSVLSAFAVLSGVFAAVLEISLHLDDRRKRKHQTEVAQVKVDSLRRRYLQKKIASLVH